MSNWNLNLSILELSIVKVSKLIDTHQRKHLLAVIHSKILHGKKGAPRYSKSQVVLSETCHHRYREVVTFISSQRRDDDERSRVLFPRSTCLLLYADDLHGNKLTPWCTTKNAFDLSAYFLEALDFCQTGRSISPEITVIIQRRLRSQGPWKHPPVEKCPAAGIYIKRTVVLQNQFELLRFHLSLVHLPLRFPLPHRWLLLSNFITSPRTSVCRAR